MASNEIPDKPKVHFTANGAPYIDAKEILSTKAGRDIITVMAKMEPTSNKPKSEPPSPIKK